LCEGAPIGFIWWCLPARLRAAGAPLDEITALTAAVTLPWVLKFTWAPIIDVTAARFGRRRWILVAQICMGLALLPLAFVDKPLERRSLLFAALLAHALAAATQDVAIDSWAIRGVPTTERGAVNGAMQVGKFVGRWLFGAGILLIANGIGIGAIALILVALLWSATSLVVVSGDRAPEVVLAEGHDTDPSEFLAALRAALRQPATWLALVFAAVSGAGFEGLGAVAGPLLVDRGLTEGSIGAFYSASLLAMIAGAALGGAASDRWGRVRSAASFLVFIAASVVAVAWGTRGAGAVPVVAPMVAMYLGYGMFIAASYALFMDLTDPRLGATQFSAYMGATNACEAWAGFAAGSAAARFGYATGLTALAAISLLGLPLLAAMRSGPDPLARRPIADPSS
jgi:MFS family permease